MSGPAFRYVAGLDLGKLSDPTALALLEWTEAPPAPPMRWHHTGQKVEPRAVGMPGPVYACRTLKRWPIGTAYMEVVAGVAKFCAQPLFTNTPPLLVVDATGVGEPVAEQVLVKLREDRIPCFVRLVTITAGNAVTLASDGRWHVSKKQLASCLQVLLGQRRLQVAPDLAEAKTLARELGTFQVKITAAGNESFEAWRERDHDDLVLAVALAAWAAESLDPESSPWGQPAEPTGFAIY
jgi:hypothetical protein